MLFNSLPNVRAMHLLISTALFAPWLLPLNILFTHIEHAQGGNSVKKGCYGFCEKFMELETELNKMEQLKEKYQSLAGDMEKCIQQFEKKINKLRDNVAKLENENKKLRKKLERIHRRNPPNETHYEEENFENVPNPTDAVPEEGPSGSVEVPPHYDEEKINFYFARHLRLESIEEEDELDNSHSQNSWDPSACHRELKIVGPKELKVIDKGKKSEGCRSVFSKSPITPKDSGIFYFEVKILEKTGPLYIGFAKKGMPLCNWVGFYEGTYAYGSGGAFFGFKGGESNCNFAVGKPEFGKEDIVGCGVNLRTKQVIFTKNGQQLDSTNLFIDPSDLYPCVTFMHPGDKIRANFGPKFKFKIETIEQHSEQ